MYAQNKLNILKNPQKLKSNIHHATIELIYKSNALNYLTVKQFLNQKVYWKNPILKFKLIFQLKNKEIFKSEID